MDRQELQLTTVSNPFQPLTSRSVKRIQWRDGMTMTDCVRESGVMDMVTDGLELRASINGLPVPNDGLDSVRPKDGDNVVFMVAVKGGGGGDGKNWAQVIAMVAVVVIAIAAPYALAAYAGIGGLTAGVAGAGWAAAAGSLTWTGLALTAGLMMGGSYLVNTLMPAKVGSSALSLADWDNSSQTYGWNLAQNLSREGLVLPVIYGMMLVTPSVINSYINVDSNGYQFLNVLYAVGEGSLTLDTELDADGVYRPAVFLNGDLASPERTSGGRIIQAGIDDALVGGTAFASSTGITNTSHYKKLYQYPSYACDDNTALDSCWFAKTYAADYNYWGYDFGVAKRIVKYKIFCRSQYIDVGVITSFTNFSTPKTSWTFQGSNDMSSWTTLDTVTGYTLDTTLERTFANATAYRYYRVYGVSNIHEIEMFGPPDVAPDVVVDYALPAFRPGDSTQTIIEGFGKTWSNNVGAFTPSKLSDAAWTTATTDGDAVTAISAVLTFPAGLCYFDDTGSVKSNTVTVSVEYKLVGAGSWTSWGTWTVTGAQASSLQRSIEISGLAAGQYQLRMMFAAAPNSGTRYVSTCYWSAMQSAIEDDFTYPFTALLGLHVLATDKFNGSMPRVTARVIRQSVSVRTSASPEVWTEEPADNPAWAAYDILVNSRYGGGVDPDDIMLADFQAWAAFCDNMATADAWAAAHAYSLGDTAILTTRRVYGDVLSGGDATGYPATNAVDGTATSEWRSSQTTTGVSGAAYIGSQMSSAVSVKRVRIKHGTNGITSAKLQSSANGSSWTDVETLTLSSGTAWQDFTISGTPTDRQYWRLLANANPGSGSWGVMELELYQAAATGNGFVYECTAAGTSGSAEPEWPVTIDGTVTDGGVTWTARLNSLRVNVCFDVATSVASALQELSITGRASVVKKGSKYGVIIDRPATPVQMFTMGNIIKDSFGVDYLDLAERANVVEITYFDEDSDYERTTVEVRDTSFESDDMAERNAPAITLHGCTSRAQAIAYGRHLLNQNKYVRKVITFDAGVDAIACQPGDVILFSHDVPQWGFSGRLVSYTAGTPSIKLDRSVTIEGGKTYSIQVRNQTTDAIEERAVTTGASTTDTLTLATAFDADPGADAVYSFGETTKVTEEFRVLSISRAADMTRKISAALYDAAIYTNGQGTTVPVPETASALEGVYGLAVTEIVRGDRTFGSLSWQGAALTWSVLCQAYDGSTGLWVPVATATVSTSYWEVELSVGRQYRFTVTSGNSSETADLDTIGDGGWKFSISCDRTFSDKDPYSLPVSIGWQLGDTQTLWWNKPAVVPATGVGEFFSMTWPWAAHKPSMTITDKPTELDSFSIWNVKLSNSDSGMLYGRLVHAGGVAGYDRVDIYSDSGRTAKVASGYWYSGGSYYNSCDVFGNCTLFPENDSGLCGACFGSGSSISGDKDFTIEWSGVYTEVYSYVKSIAYPYYGWRQPQGRWQEDYRDNGSYMPFYFCVKPGTNVSTCKLTWDKAKVPAFVPTMYISEVSEIGWQPTGTTYDMSAVDELSVTVSATDKKWFKVWFDGNTVSSTINMYDRAQDIGGGAGLNYFSVDVFPIDPRPEAILPVETEGYWLNEFDNSAMGTNSMSSVENPPTGTRIATVIDPQRAYRLFSYSYIDRTFTCTGVPVASGSQLTFGPGGSRLFGVAETMPLPSDPSIDGPIEGYGGTAIETSATALAPGKVYRMNIINRMSVFQKRP